MTELNGKVVNEENYKKVKKSLKKTGKILLIIGGLFALAGIILLIVGFCGLSNFQTQSLNPTQPPKMPSVIPFVIGGILLAVGIAMLIFGVYATFFAHGREIMAFGASTTAPVVGETVDYIANKTAPGLGKVAGSVAEGIAGGIARGKAAGSKVKCSNCGELNSPQNKFCGKCGTPLKVEKHCPQCGTKIENGVNFCPNCGNKVEE